MRDRFDWWLTWFIVVAFVLCMFFFTASCLPFCQYPGDIGGLPGIPGTNGTMKPILNSMNWVATLSVLGIGLSVFALLNGNKLGFAGIGASIATLYATMAIAKYAAWIAWFGLAFSLVGVVLICIYSICIKNKALKEIITNVQKFKDNTPGLDVNKLKGELVKQSKSTQKLVQKVKGQLKIKGEI